MIENNFFTAMSVPPRQRKASVGSYKKKNIQYFGSVRLYYDTIRQIRDRSRTAPEFIIIPSPPANRPSPFSIFLGQPVNSTTLKKLYHRRYRIDDLSWIFHFSCRDVEWIGHMDFSIFLS